MDALQERVLSFLDRDELIQMTKDVVNIDSPTGGEEAIGQYLATRYADLGLPVQLMEVEPGRNNVIATWKGTGDGADLLFLGHMDYAPGIGKPEAEIVEGNWIAGIGASNMKSAFPCYYMATKMLMRAGIQPRGDLRIAGVVGEIERAPIGAHQGAECRGAGYGARYLASHSHPPDIVINGEPTGLRVQIANGGYMFVRLTTRGVVQHASYRQYGVDALMKMEKVIPEVRAWEAEYQEMFTHPFMRPRVNVGAIEGGVPQNPPLVAAFCHAYVDVILLPNTNILAVKREVQSLVQRLNDRDPDLGLEWDIYMVANGYEIGRDEYLPRLARASHQLVTGQEPFEPEAERFGVSSDNHVFADIGAASITYGPAGVSRVVPGGHAAYDPVYGEVVNMDHLEICAKVYALCALDIITKGRQEVM